MLQQAELKEVKKKKNPGWLKTGPFVQTEKNYRLRLNYASDNWNHKADCTCRLFFVEE